MAWLVWKPTKDSISKRHDYIEGQIKEAEESRNEALKKLAEAQKEKVAAINQAQQIIDDAQKEAYSIKQKANKDIESAKSKAKKELHNEIVDVALNASSQILSREVSTKDNSKLVDQFIDDLNNEKESK